MICRFIAIVAVQSVVAGTILESAVLDGIIREIRKENAIYDLCTHVQDLVTYTRW